MELKLYEWMFLRRAVRSHPDIGRHIENLELLNSLPQPWLLELARLLGLEIEIAARGDGSDPRDGSAITLEGLELRRYSHLYPAFNGQIRFELALECFGHRVAHQARAEYSYTPEWEYFDTRKREVMLGWDSSQVGISILAEPEGDQPELERSDGSKHGEGPAWVQLNLLEGGLPAAVSVEIHKRIDEDARRQDVERRNAWSRRHKKQP